MSSVSVGGMYYRVSSAKVSSNFVSATWYELTDLPISIPISLSKMAACLDLHEFLARFP